MNGIPPKPGVDLYSKEYLRNPYPTLQRLREHFPVCELDPGNIYALSRYTDARFALSRPDLFTSGIGALGAPAWLPEDCRRSWFIQTMDPPEHTHYRAKVNKLFVPSVIDGYAPQLRAHATALVNAISAGDVCEFTSAFAYPYVGYGIGHITGMADDIDMEELRRGIEARELNASEIPSPERAQTIIEGIRNDSAIYDRIVAARQRNPRADLVTELLAIEVDEEKLTTEQLRSAIDLFLGAGLHTTAQTLTNAMLCLASNPELHRFLASTPAQLGAFIEEVMRAAGPLFYQPRITTQPVTLHGVTIPAAARVAILIASANRDADQFREPDKFDIHRPNNKQHLSFGYGAHFCIGAALARLEIKIALEAILMRFTRIDCPPSGDLEWIGTIATRAVRALPVTFT